ncbi:Phosphoenolpyruvate-protein phosphotransferase of PTS system [Lachnospiraceae bacterium TWA4]|nr:Phosphoenolpyruvate-protein phosphotransferase of PTS system [Lachnospiraceae bacterium TWA4]
MLGIKDIDVSKISSDTILVLRRLTPTLAIQLDSTKIRGVVTEFGGRNSHSAIIMRMLEIPAVFGVVGCLDFIQDDDVAIIDGTDGTVFINPRGTTYKKYQEKMQIELEEKRKLKDFLTKETLTKDGQKVQLLGNIEKASDVLKVLENGGEGVGLFRTEFLFVDRTTLPNEDEQFEAYKKAAIQLDGKPLVIRTLDIGGDKQIEYLGLGGEPNPFLGYRAIRFSLDRMDIFQTQLRAILRASAYGKVSVMIPMVTSIEEIRRAKTILNLIKEELESCNIPFDKDISFGVMIETPAAALLIDIFAKEVDFLALERMI